MARCHVLPYAIQQATTTGMGFPTLCQASLSVSRSKRCFPYNFKVHDCAKMNILRNKN